MTNKKPLPKIPTPDDPMEDEDEFKSNYSYSVNICTDNTNPLIKKGKTVSEQLVKTKASGCEPRDFCTQTPLERAISRVRAQSNFGGD